MVSNTLMENNCCSSLLVKIGIYVFVYSICIMFIFQTWIIPILEPGAINGLIPGDPQYYYGLAIEASHNISKDGLGAWELRPHGQGSVGILSMIYYLFKSTSPLTVIILNALLHTLASIFLILILSRIVNIKYSLIASLYFIISPYEMHWLSQVNKESYVISGVFIFIYGFIRLFESKNSGFLISLFWMVLGSFLISVVRPYILQILFIDTLGIFWVVISFYRNKNMLLIRCGILILYAILIVPLLTGSASDKSLTAYATSYKNLNKNVDNSDIRDYSVWSPLALLPEVIDKRLFALSASRAPYERFQTASNITTRDFNLVDEAQFHSAIDMFLYTPRAMQLALFSPFPKDWPVFACNNDSSTFKLFVSFEMIYIYFGFVFLLVGMYKHSSLKFSLSISYLISVLLIYGLSIPNIGVLYRYRYSYIMLLASIGIAFFIKCFFEKEKSSV